MTKSARPVLPNRFANGPLSDVFLVNPREASGSLKLSSAKEKWPDSGDEGRSITLSQEEQWC